jgi:lipid II:glycine glycyltransferase (peptidoglycan interpeptide bridge formation enzyme)
MDSSEIIKIIKEDFRQTDAWGEYISNLGFKPKFLKNNSLIHEFKIGPFTVLKSFRPELSEEILDEIQKIANKNVNLICKISPNFDFNESLKEKFGYEKVNSTMSPIRTCIRDLTQSYDEIYQSFSENTRYKINRSVREKDIIEIIQKPDDNKIDGFYDLLEKRQKENNFMTYSRKEFKILRNCFKDNSFLITAYDIKGKPVVSNFYLKNIDKVTYFSGSLNSINHKSKAGYQLINEAFKFFKSQDVKVYDFEGLSDERDPQTYNDWLGYTNFKLKFGDKVFQYPLAMIKYNNSVFRQMLRIFKLI